jgi:hypothetical protein
MANVDLNNLPSNNIEAPNRRPQKVALRGSVRQGKQGGLASEVRDVFNTQFSSLVIPSIMRLIYDFLEGALRMTILGKASDSSRGRVGGHHTAYSNPYRSNSPTYHSSNRSSGYQQARRIQSSPYTDIYFESHRDAEEALEVMKAIVQEYGWVSVGHLYSSLGITNNHTHHAWGWTDVSRVGISRDDAGFYIDLPNPVSK